MNLENIVIVLCNPEESRNVGAACRAMANNAVHTLRIVGSREAIDDEKVRVLAIHAAYIWENCQFFSSITEATLDCSCVVATTRRRGKKRKGKLLLPEEFSAQANNITENGGKVAIVFGNERTGLTDFEVDECTLGVTIPSAEDFASLNLSHAVQIMCYHLFREKNAAYRGYTPINLYRLDKTVGTITENLKKIGFFSYGGDEARENMSRFWKETLSRAALSEGEAQYLELIFNKAAGLSLKK